MLYILSVSSKWGTRKKLEGREIGNHTASLPFASLSAIPHFGKQLRCALLECNFFLLYCSRGHIIERAADREAEGLVSERIGARGRLQMIVRLVKCCIVHLA